MRFSRLLLVLPFATLACGYVMAGKWDDSSLNWWRAFGAFKPSDVVVLHSQYWRSAHWTYEAGYTFEIQANARFREQLFKDNAFTLVVLRDDEEPRSFCFADCPSWFAPGSRDRYQVWAYSDDSESNFRLLVDTKSGNIFLTDYQV